MAVEETPLGLKKPDGNELFRNGDNVIAHNAQKTQDLVAATRARIAILEQVAGFPGDPLDLADEVVALLIGDTGSDTRTALNSIFAPSAEVVATAARFPGLDPSGPADSSPALQAWLDAIPNGGTGVLPPYDYRASGLTVTGKTVHIKMRGAKLIQATNDTILRFRGSWGPVRSVTSSALVNRQVNELFRDQTRLTFATPPGWAAGDTIRVFCDDVIPGARPGTGGQESRTGEFATVFEVSGNDVYLAGGLRDTYNTNVRAQKLNGDTITIDGYASETPDASMSTWTGAMLDIQGATCPVVNGFKIRQGCGIGALFQGCFGYNIAGLDVRLLNNNGAAGQYGYAVVDLSCEGGYIDAPLVRNVRHGFTDDTSRISAGDSRASHYGRSRNALIVNGRAFGASGAAWDTHHCGEGHLFLGCRTVASETAHNLRGRKHTVVDSYAVRCRNGYQAMTETSGAFSYEHRIINCYTETALYEAVSVSNLQRDGRLTVTIAGGRHSSAGIGLRATRALVKLTQGVEFVAPAGQMASGSALITIVDAAVDVSMASLDLSPSTAGANLAFVSLADATSSIVGRNLAMTAGGALARVEAAFRGVAGVEGAVSVEDYRFDTAPAVVLLNVTAGSMLTNARPSTNPVLLYAPEMRSLGGSPALDWVGPSATNRANVFLMDSATTEDIGCAIVPPADWKSVNVTLIWTNMAASSGDVRWGLNRVVAGDGEDVTANTATALTASAPTSVGTLKYTQLAAGISVTGGKLLVLRLRRDGGHASDTLANDAGVIGALVEKAS